MILNDTTRMLILNKFNGSGNLYMSQMEYVFDKPEQHKSKVARRMPKSNRTVPALCAMSDQPFQTAASCANEAMLLPDEHYCSDAERTPGGGEQSPRKAGLRRERQRKLEAAV